MFTEAELKTNHSIETTLEYLAIMRRKMSRKKSRRNFRRNAGAHPKNHRSPNQRGGYRL